MLLREVLRRYALPIRVLGRLGLSSSAKLLPDASTALTVDGFPRSGNTFAVTLLATALPNIECSHHTHAPAAFRAASRMGIPAIGLLREPRAALGSLARRNIWAGRTSHRRFQRDAADYLEMCDAFERHDVPVVCFACLTGQPERFVELVSQTLGVTPVGGVDPDRALQIIEERSSDWDQMAAHAGPDAVSAPLPGRSSRPVIDVHDELVQRYRDLVQTCRLCKGGNA